ncbi:Arc family DNA-binding protein [Pseudomonas qingdaonensis]|uniref:Arc family DNA-binding protein n=1 Tax=Pseudomonas qingdaonensis TaxID=2056231 RepID=UPI0028AB9EDE|nr:Arc family DNA-binding protein [Pseudomonas qingdaonensis]
MSFNKNSREADKFVVRLPDGMRDDIQAAADADDRSMNSVFIKSMREYLHGQQQKQVLLGALVLAGRSAPANTSEFNIDERIKLIADARRYRWLRDRERIEGADNDLLVLRGDTYFAGDELDREIDTALRLEQLQEQQP